MKQKPRVQVDALASVMRIDKGEEIVGAWVTPEIPEVGFYKLLAKKKCDGTCEWVHFVERVDGKKERFLLGKVKDVKELATVVNLVNRNLGRVFGPDCKLRFGKPVVRSVEDVRLGIERSN